MPTSSTAPLFVLGCVLLVLIMAPACPLPGRQPSPTEATVDLAQAQIVVPAKHSKQEENAVRMLVDEIAKRTLIRLPVVNSWPAETIPVIACGQRASLTEFAGSFANRGDFNGAAEGFHIRVEPKARAAPAVLVVGNDIRGELFGVGRLLREMTLSRGKITIPANLNISTAPAYPLRGHQLGYRPKTNSYDGWNVAQWEQYIRDLALFGTNAIELIPPRSDDDADSPHFPLPPMEMMVAMSRLADDYGLDVWIWYPAMDPNYADSATVEFALKEWADVFKRLPRIDAVFVPGGDPGHTRPGVLMNLLQKQTENLHRYHPRAQMWVSPQSFNQQWLDEFYSILRQDRPAWLSGVVYGPQVRVSLPELRQAVPSQYPIRRYPDITHSLRCQYPVPDWDLAYALTESRECINPRPLDQAQIFHAFEREAIGFLTYSEGCNDDVNKIVWSALGWDPKADIREVLRQYSRVFLGQGYAEDFSQGILALERNWRGPLLGNDSVYTTLQQFQAMEKKAAPQDLLNWRFQQGLYRAYYDAYERRRLLFETELEERAMEKLRQAGTIGALSAMRQAEAILEQAVTSPVATDWHSRVHELAEALFQSIRMQLSVERYQAISVGRGATLDTLDVPLNNRLWLRDRFARIRELTDEQSRRRGIEEIVNWTNPGPGGFYDDLGSLANRPHLVRESGYPKDPAYLRGAMTGFTYAPGWRMSWCRHAQAHFDQPLRMHYPQVDPTARYKLRVVYAGDSMRSRIRLQTKEGIEIHPYHVKPTPVQPIEFDIPAAATARGNLDLAWYEEPGRGGNGRGCQVAEVWLIKRSSASK